MDSLAEVLRECSTNSAALSRNLSHVELRLGRPYCFFMSACPSLQMIMTNTFSHVDSSKHSMGEADEIPLKNSLVCILSPVVVTIVF